MSDLGRAGMGPTGRTAWGQLTELAKAWEQGGRHIADSTATIVLVAQEPDDQRHHDWLLYDLTCDTFCRLERWQLADLRFRGCS